MSNIVNFNEFKSSEHMPITEEDFDNLDNYKTSILFKLLKFDKKHQKKLLDNIFIRLHKEEDIEKFKQYLYDHDMYNSYFLDISHSDDEVYKIHLSLYYDDTYIKEIYGNKCNLAKQVYKSGKDYKLSNNTFDYLIKLSELDCDIKTDATIRKVVMKLIKKEVVELQLYRLREMIYGNYFLILDSKYIKETQTMKMTKILKKVNNNYNRDED